MKPITWDLNLSTERFTKSLRQFAEKHLSAIDISKIAKFLYESNWLKCHNCEIDCENCPHPQYNFYLIIEIPETLPLKNSWKNRVFRFEAYSDVSSGFTIQLGEGNDILIATTKEIYFSDYGLNRDEPTLKNLKKDEVK